MVSWHSCNPYNIIGAEFRSRLKVVIHHDKATTLLLHISEARVDGWFHVTQIREVFSNIYLLQPHFMANWYSSLRLLGLSQRTIRRSSPELVHPSKDCTEETA
jgi:hypothetical protein